MTACSGTQVSQPLDIPTDSTASVVDIALFRDARSLAADPSGRLYVVDAAESTVSILTVEGEVVGTYGGPGTGEYSLLDPADVDPTNGLDLFVADLGNGRIQRFSRDGEFIESVAVPVGDPGVVLGGDVAEGRPLAVAVGPGGALYAVEGERRVVLRWESDRRLSRLLGLPEDGGGALIEPVDIVVSGKGTVFVADRQRNAVLVYDGLGTFRRAISGRASGGVRAVALAPSAEGERLLIVGPRAIAVHEASGGLVDVVRPAVSEDLVGAAVAGGDLYVLTRTRLLRVE
ncbi:MAG: NHL repeat-containing protein [Bacteroidetes bacterium]|nr:NHL repeat-containing protein [Bacteroidota bacterium]